MQKLTNKASVKSIFNTRIAVLFDFLTLAQTPQTEKLLIKRKIWRIYNNIEKFRNFSDVKTTAVFELSIGLLCNELRESNTDNQFIEIIRKYIWQISDDIKLMEDNLFWKEKESNNFFDGGKNE